MSLIVEKTVITKDGRTDYFAVATSERNQHSVCTSLTFEAHLTPWNTNRLEVEALQREIDWQATPSQKGGRR